MNKKGFTLVELLATIVILGIIVGITVIVIGGNFGRAKEKTEDIFLGTLDDALNVYLDTDAKSLRQGNERVGIIHKTHGKIDLYRIGSVSFNDVINSSMSPIHEDDFTNPANEEAECNLNSNIIEIYRDDDYIYYYRFSAAALNCLNNVKDDSNNDLYVTNLPRYEIVESVPE